MGVVDATGGSLYISDPSGVEFNYVTPDYDVSRGDVIEGFDKLSCDISFTGEFTGGYYAMLDALGMPTCEMKIKYGLWFAPLIFLHDAEIYAIQQDYGENSTSITADVRALYSSLKFAHWWHCPVWWLYGLLCTIRRILRK